MSAGGGEGPGARVEEGDDLREVSPPPSPGTAEEMDAQLQEALLQTLKTGLKKDSALPCAAGVLWNRHMLGGRQAGVRLDLAASSHGKMSAFLEAQKAAGLVHLKRDKRSGELMLTGVERRHPAYRAFQPRDDTAAAAEADLEAAQAQLGALEISCLYRIPTGRQPMETILATLAEDDVGGAITEGKGGRLYSRNDVAAAAGRYVEQHGLATMGGGVVLLDATLAHALFQGAIAKGQPVPQHVPARELAERLVGRMLPQHRLVRGHLNAVRRGELPQVHVSTAKRAGGKSVTMVRGLEAYLLDPEAEARELARLLARSASCADVPGKGAQQEVVVQGEVVNQVVERLTSAAVGVPRDRIRAPESKKGKGKSGGRKR